MEIQFPASFKAGTWHMALNNMAGSCNICIQPGKTNSKLFMLY